MIQIIGAVILSCQCLVQGIRIEQDIAMAHQESDQNYDSAQESNDNGFFDPHETEEDLEKEKPSRRLKRRFSTSEVNCTDPIMQAVENVVHRVQTSVMNKEREQKKIMEIPYSEMTREQKKIALKKRTVKIPYSKMTKIVHEVPLCLTEECIAELKRNDSMRSDSTDTDSMRSDSDKKVLVEFNKPSEDFDDEDAPTSKSTGHVEHRFFKKDNIFTTGHTYYRVIESGTGAEFDVLVDDLELLKDRELEKEVNDYTVQFKYVNSEKNKALLNKFEVITDMNKQPSDFNKRRRFLRGTEKRPIVVALQDAHIINGKPIVSLGEVVGHEKDESTAVGYVFIVKLGDEKLRKNVEELRCTQKIIHLDESKFQTNMNKYAMPLVSAVARESDLIESVFVPSHRQWVGPFWFTLACIAVFVTVYIAGAGAALLNGAAVGVVHGAAQNFFSPEDEQKKEKRNLATVDWIIWVLKRYFSDFKEVACSINDRVDQGEKLYSKIRTTIFPPGALSTYLNTAILSYISMASLYNNGLSYYVMWATVTFFGYTLYEHSSREDLSYEVFQKEVIDVVKDKSNYMKDAITRTTHRLKASNAQAQGALQVDRNLSRSNSFTAKYMSPNLRGFFSSGRGTPRSNVLATGNVNLETELEAETVDVQEVSDLEIQAATDENFHRDCPVTDQNFLAMEQGIFDHGLY
eukprot:gene249-424_t